MKRRTSVTWALAALAALAAPGRAQEPTIDLGYALAELDRAIMGLAASSTDFQGDLEIVARLHDRLITIRDVWDPDRAHCFVEQAALAAALGDQGRARKLLAQAVGQGIMTGNLGEAADASVTAAVLAAQAGDRGAVQRFRTTAENLALRHGLTREQSRHVLARLYGDDWKTELQSRGVFVEN